MSYSPSGNIVNKLLESERLINGQVSNVSYDNTYTYPERPHTVIEAGDNRYVWDRNGNQVHHQNPFGRRFMCWDEENRLSAIHDLGEMSNLSVYLYNDAGERGNASNELVE